LKQAKKAKKDFDVVAKILTVIELDEYTNEIKISDQTGENWFLLALKLKFQDL
jgi:hypothetical protein